MAGEAVEPPIGSKFSENLTFEQDPTDRQGATPVAFVTAASDVASSCLYSGLRAQGSTCRILRLRVPDEYPKNAVCNGLR